MIRIYSPDDSKDFYKYIDVPTKNEVRGARDYVVRTHNGALLVSFSLVDHTTVTLQANEEYCSLMTESQSLVDKVKNIDDADGFHEMFLFFLALTSNDISDLQAMEDKVEELEDELFTEGKPNHGGIADIMSCRKEILQKKRYYEEMELLSDELADMEPTFSFIDKKFDRLYEFILRCQEAVDQVREAYQSQIDIEQNDTMKILTVATTIFLPLQLITGWFGMNLLMPEFNWSHGYLYVVILSIVVVAIEVLFFRRKKWF